VTISYTFATSHLPATTSLAAGAAAEKPASLNTSKYLQTTHMFVRRGAKETSGCFNQTGLELITKLGKLLILVTGDK